MQRKYNSTRGPRKGPTPIYPKLSLLLFCFKKKNLLGVFLPTPSPLRALSLQTCPAHNLSQQCGCVTIWDIRPIFWSPSKMASYETLDSEMAIWHSMREDWSGSLMNAALIPFCWKVGRGAYGVEGTVFGGGCWLCARPLPPSAL